MLPASSLERTSPPQIRACAVRLRAALLLSIGCALWWVAFRIFPSPAGFGSHVQLGLPPCSMPMLTGYPCPTCGMTTSVAFAARGQLASSFRAQPAGLILSLGMLAVIIGSTATMLTGQTWKKPRSNSPSLWVAMVIGIVILGWLMKIGLGLADGTLPL
ncbi:MAG: DUF2752 domain-containing protein [Planctomycetes bacterium]|nr:DUF2752 domain-containing protein [Planctomycetota bacterium]